MDDREATKEDWGPGPWQDEEDHAVWVDPTTDLDCMINRNQLGALCGYVGVPPSHPLHGKHYNEVPGNVQVHGGLTYSAACQEDGEICHVPQEGREADIWWLGFDCAHAFDNVPGLIKQMSDIRVQTRNMFESPSMVSVWDHGVYRDFAYVTQECEKLALQLIKVEA